MTPQDLQALLDAGDAEGCLSLFAKATEAERRTLAKTAAARLKLVTADVPGGLMSMLTWLSDEDMARLYPTAALHRGGLRAAQVAVLATATPGELKKFGERCLLSIDDAIAVLSARRPPWVGEWAEVILSWGGRGHWVNGLADRWRFVRRLVRAGLCARPRGPQYIQGMLGAFPEPKHDASVRQGLLDDPGLLDDEIWEIFETEPMPGMLGLLQGDPRLHPQLRWEVALAGFADEGRLSRTRLLDASLGGLERDYHEERARWFALLHETLGRPWSSAPSGPVDTSAWRRAITRRR
jgi:hypothetical protein